ncbi:MAG: tyrosine recombinase [Limnochordia bacterium]|nr:tyrosine recombinase [Limnochordia bacterium]MDD2628650.1 tyrosine recombinase [Limnochordia bacterium]MDD4516911.1 tyrosine recombinase [Limnochordia bacterium]
MDGYIDEFIVYLQAERNYSEHTVVAYARDVVDFHEFCISWFGEDCVDIKKIDQDLIRWYLASLWRRDLTKTTIGRKLAAVRAFFNYLYTRGIIAENPALHIARPKTERPLPTVLKGGEIQLLMESCDDTTLGQRNRAILELFYGAGIRLSELASLRLPHLDLSTKQLRVYGKGRKQRIALFGEEAARALERYINDARKCLLTKSTKQTNILFLNYRGGSLSTRGIQKIIKKHAETAIARNDVSPHTLRHSFATHLLIGGCDLRCVQELLGHEKLSTTQIYTRVDKTHLKAVHNMAHPRS